MEVKMAWDGPMIEFEGRVEHSTAKAWLVIDTMSNNQAWLPKSVGKIVRDVDPEGLTLFEAPESWMKHSKFI
jgi:hypothetical protein